MVQENYSKLLSTPEWKTKRARILKRDNYSCTCCHLKKKTLYVHHTYYKAYRDGIKFMPWEYPDEALVTLCFVCHKQAHRTNYIAIKYCLK